MDIYLQAYLVLVSFCFIAERSFLFFHKLEVPGDPVLKSISIIFLRASAYFVSHFGNSYFKLFQYICYNDLRSVIFVNYWQFFDVFKNYYVLFFLRHNATAHLIDYSMAPHSSTRAWKIPWTE